MDDYCGYWTKAQPASYRRNDSQTGEPVIGLKDRHQLILLLIQLAVDRSQHLMSVRLLPSRLARATSRGINSLTARRLRSCVRGSISERLSRRSFSTSSRIRAWRVEFRVRFCVSK